MGFAPLDAMRDWMLSKGKAPRITDKGAVRAINVDEIATPKGAIGSDADTMRRVGTKAPAYTRGQPFDSTDPIQPGRPRQSLFPQGVIPKQYDFGAYQNVYSPRIDQTNTFEILRELADASDMVGACVLYRKNKLRGERFEFYPKRKEDKENAEIKSACDAANAFWEQPDPMSRMPWDQWITQLAEEVMITDAPCVAPMRTVKGDTVGFVNVDGATITPLIDKFGLVPQPPFAAYQQWIKGTPRGAYTTEDLYYRPMNSSVRSVYGRPPLEAVLSSVVTGIRRWSHNLSFYADGSIPYVWVQLPADSSPDSLRPWFEAYNSLMTGSDAERHKVQLLPPGATPIEIRPAVWTKDQDEWLARCIAAGFGVSPVAWVAIVNRSTAEVMEDVDTDLWAKSLKNFLTSVVNDLEMVRNGGRTDIVGTFVYDKTEIPESRARALKTMWDMGAISSQYVAEEILGLDPDPKIQALPLAPMLNQAPAPMEMGGMPDLLTPPEPLVTPEPEPAPAESTEITFNELTLALERLKAIGDEEMTNAVRQAMASRLGVPPPAPIPVQSEVVDELVIRDAKPVPQPSPFGPPEPPEATVEPPELEPAVKAELATLRRYVGKHGVEKAKAFRPGAIPRQTFEAIVTALEGGLPFDDAVTKARKRPGLERARSIVLEAVQRYLKAQQAEAIAEAVKEYEAKAKAN